MLFVQLTHEDIDCGSFVTPTLMDITANISWTNASLSIAPFAGNMTEITLILNPVVLDENTVCATPLATMMPNEMPTHAPTSSPTDDSVPLTQNPVFWGVLGLSVSCLGIIVGVSCWSYFWHKYRSEKKEMKEEKQEAEQENKPLPQKPDIDFFIANEMEGNKFTSDESNFTMMAKKKKGKPVTRYYQ